MKKLIITIFFVIFGIIIIISATSGGVIILMKTKFSETKAPEAYITPILREIETPGPDRFREFSYYGLTFKVPWTQITEIKERPGAVLLKFPYEKTIAIIDTRDQPGLVASLLGDKSEETKRIKDFFGEQILKSDYIFYKNILESNPNQITIFMPKKEATARSVLIVLKTVLIKGVLGESKVKGVYSFTTDNIKGFQFGSPGEINRVYIEFFDNRDKQYGIIMGNIPQYEIDFILSSIKTL